MEPWSSAGRFFPSKPPRKPYCLVPTVKITPKSSCGNNVPFKKLPNISFSLPFSLPYDSTNHSASLLRPSSLPWNMKRQDYIISKMHCQSISLSSLPECDALMMGERLWGADIRLRLCSTFSKDGQLTSLSSSGSLSQSEWLELSSNTYFVKNINYDYIGITT